MTRPKDLEAFAASRLPQQERSAASLAGSVRRALHRLQNEHADWADGLIKAAIRLLRRIYRTESGKRTSPELRAAVAAFRKTVREALNHTGAPTAGAFAAHTQAIALSLANAAMNAGAAAAGVDGSTKRWVTMRDEAVRPSHRPMDGVTVPLADTFNVGGVRMPYPGWPGAPPALTQNCRCVLQVLAPAPAQVSLSSGQEVTMTAQPDLIEEPDVEDVEDVEDEDAMDDTVPWHGVLAPEDVVSGDGRKFGAEALRWRDLPLPLSWQKVNADGHAGSVVVGRIDEIWREDGLIKALGAFLDTAEADEAIGLLADGGIRGVSVDVDDATMELEGEGDKPVQVFPDGRICGATLCPIPAFQEAFVKLGDWPGEDALVASCPCESQEELGIDEGAWDGSASNYDDEQWHRACLVHLHDGEPASKAECKLPILTPEGVLSRAGVHAAAGRVDQTDAPPEAIDAAKAALRGAYEDLDEEVPESLMVSAPDEEMAASWGWGGDELARGPGWITNPVETRRLHRYWTRGKGAAKIGWGRGGDFNRCRRQLSKYIGPGFLNRTCAQWHFDALGYWPATHAKRLGHSGRSIALVAAVGTVTPARYFANPQLRELTPMAVEDDRRIYGHLAGWETCHIGLGGTCVTPPHSPSNYAYFHVGAVNTPEGLLAAGRMTMATGHADRYASAAVAMAHYDDTGTVIADIVAGEDEFGIWVSGKLRDETTDKQVAALLQAPPSGDWRDIGGSLEMVAALAVNVPGFPVPRIGIKGGRQRSLAAAGVVMPNEPVRAIDISAAVMAAVDELEARARRRKMSALAASSGRDPRGRMADLAQKVGGDHRVRM